MKIYIIFVIIIAIVNSIARCRCIATWEYPRLIIMARWTDKVVIVECLVMAVWGAVLVLQDYSFLRGAVS